MPEPLEQERKFRIESYDLSKVGQVVQVRIVQNYLAPQDGYERRVRARYIDGGATYYYTKKKPTGTRGVRIENERQISQRKYESLLRESDPSSMTIIKTRHTFVWDGHHFELDVYEAPEQNLVILEVEVEDMSDHIEIPPGFVAIEVTGDERYSNAGIARGSLRNR